MVTPYWQLEKKRNFSIVEKRSVSSLLGSKTGCADKRKVTKMVKNLISVAIEFNFGLIRVGLTKEKKKPEVKEFDFGSHGLNLI